MFIVKKMDRLKDFGFYQNYPNVFPDNWYKVILEGDKSDSYICLDVNPMYKQAQKNEMVIEVFFEEQYTLDRESETHYLNLDILFCMLAEGVIEYRES